MRIAIRVDGNSSIGLGHIIRMETLAQAFISAGTEVIFLSKNPEAVSIATLISQIPAAMDINTELNWVKEHVITYNCDMLIIDSYTYGQEELIEVGSWPIYSIYYDDLNRHPFHVSCVVNGNISSEKLDYQGTSRFIVGAEYALLRTEFANLPVRRVNNKVTEVLITLGGADTCNATPKILEWLNSHENFSDYNYQVVIGPAFTNQAQLDGIAEACSNVLCYRNPDMAALITTCDLAISGAGQTVHELMAAGLPALLIEAADNQHLNALCAAEKGVAINLGPFQEITAEDLQVHFDIVCRDWLLRIKMAENGQSLIDGGGAVRLAHRLIKELESK